MKRKTMRERSQKISKRRETEGQMMLIMTANPKKRIRRINSIKKAHQYGQDSRLIGSIVIQRMPSLYNTVSY